MTDITLKYITGTETTETITIKDFSFVWIEEFWDDSGVSLTGAKRDDFRGYSALLELQFEHDDQMETTLNSIATTLAADGVVQYIESGESLVVVPESATRSQDYLYQILRKPATLVLVGDIQDDRSFVISGILCGSLIVTCGQTNVRCG